MMRNSIFGSASLRPSLQQQGSNRKNLNICQRPRQPAQASPLGHFRHSWHLQRLRWAVWLFEKYFAGTVWKEQITILLWTASPSHGNVGPQAQCSHGKAQTTSPSGSITWQWPFSWNVFDSSPTIHERNKRSWRPWNGGSHGEGCGCPMWRLGRPPPYGRSCLDTAKQEPCPQQREERRQKRRLRLPQKSVLQDAVFKLAYASQALQCSSACPYLPVLFCLSCSAYPVLPVLFCLFFSAVLSWLSSSCVCVWARREGCVCVDIYV